MFGSDHLDRSGVNEEMKRKRDNIETFARDPVRVLEGQLFFP